MWTMGSCEHHIVGNLEPICVKQTFIASQGDESHLGYTKYRMEYGTHYSWPTRISYIAIIG